ncbi:MAG TPA: hypothetical protein VFH06_05785 [Candidatus Saccharimonadales bacterium]|nr:hypothetical protein [Candidatus Saccharimonadales bacterium]
MRVRDKEARKAWRRQAEGAESGPPGYERELMLAYLNAAEKWAEVIEESWDWNADDTSFAEAAQTTYNSLMSSIPSTEFGGKVCNLFVNYLAETWEFGDRLRSWYRKSTRE